MDEVYLKEVWDISVTYSITYVTPIEAPKQKEYQKKESKKIYRKKRPTNWQGGGRAGQ